MLSTLYSHLTGKPLGDWQYEFVNRQEPRATGAVIDIPCGTRVSSYRVIAAGPVRPQGQYIVVELIRKGTN